MSTCCDAGAAGCPLDPPADAALCPADHSRGKPVGWLTVAALSRGPVPRRQRFWICRSPACEVVYFGEGGARLATAELSVRPGFKEGGDGLVCYCFHHRRGDIARELAQTGSTAVLETIKREAEAGNCACEVRNPGGKCCLGEVQDAIRRLEQPAAAQE